ncbi:hypothetical protein ONZ45_g7387 [Pleurotus djamor]|nr:hypothetical protein ONZ45_g7387 [Pleurotus djamor]
MPHSRATQNGHGHDPVLAIPFPEERTSQVEGLIRAYTAQIIPRDFSNIPGKGESKVVVLVTGTTGVLGSHLLQSLVTDSRVDQVYTLDRPSTSAPLYDRQARAFRKHSLDVSTLSSLKLSSLEGTLIEPHFGLNPETYEKLLDSVTVVIHNAWMLNFKHTVLGFKPLITGMVNLINFAHKLRSRNVRFIFASSISSVQNFGCVDQVPDAVVSDHHIALGLGYGESKHVAERVLASSQISVCSIRLPQLYLDRSWPTSGWLALVIKSSLAMVNLALARGAIPPAVNPYHPHPVAFVDVLVWARDAISTRRGGEPFAIISSSSWVEKLRKLERSGVSTKKVPAIKLLGFLSNLVDREKSLDSVPYWAGYPPRDITAARLVPPSIDQLKPLDKETVATWVDQWADEGFLKLGTESV